MSENQLNLLLLKNKINLFDIAKCTNKVRYSQIFWWNIFNTCPFDIFSKT